MGDPAMQGRPAASAAQTGEKSFPAGTDPAGITVIHGAAHASVEVGSPVQPELRQVTPVADMGAGYREADPETDPH